MKNSINLKLLLILLYVLSARSELKLVAEFFRHGARQAIYDFWNAEIFPDWGELTSVGMRQHFVLGQTLRQRYIEDLQFLSPYYNSSEMFIQSTDVNRTLRSAICQLYGFYPLEFGPYLPIDLPEDIVRTRFYFSIFNKLSAPWGQKPQNFTSSQALPFAYEPLPIHTQLSLYDYVLKAYSSKTCPVNNRLQEEQRESSEYQSMLREIEGSLLKVAGIINYTTQSVNFFQAYEIMDVFQDDIFWNKPLPKGIPEDEQLWKDLTFAYNLYMPIEMFATETQKKLVATPVFDELITIFNQSLTKQSPMKWRMYSAHDTTIGMIVAALNLTDYQCMYEIYKYGHTNATQCIYDYPSFATSLIVELYEESNSSSYVKVLYNGEYQNLCGQNSTSCEYNTFVTRMQNYKLSYSDFLTLCHQTSDQKQETENNGNNIEKQSNEKQNEIEKSSIQNDVSMLIAEKRVSEKERTQFLSTKMQASLSFFLTMLIIMLIYLIINEKKEKLKKKTITNLLSTRMNQINIQ